MRMTETEIEKRAKFVVALANRERRALGFIPSTIYPWAIANNRCEVIKASGWELGFLLRGPIRAVTKIYQIAVLPGGRLEDAGRAMWESMRDQCIEAGVMEITLHCACDLAANAFWEELGLEIQSIRPQRTLTGRQANKWRWVLPRGRELEKEIETLDTSPTPMRLTEILGYEHIYRESLKKRAMRKLYRVSGGEKMEDA